MHTSRRRSRRLQSLSLVASVTCAYVTLASAQTTPIWNGSVRCEIDLKGPGYVSHETHTWTLTGAPPPDGGTDYPGTWTVSGSGSRTPTDTLASSATWTTQGLAPGVRMAIFVRQSDQRLLVFTRHGQLSTASGTTGTQQTAELGRRAQSQPITKSVSEWRPFPTIQDAATSTRVTGSSTTPLTRLDASQPIGTSGQAVCTWDLRQGAAAAGAAVTASAPATESTVEKPTLTAAGTTAPSTIQPVPTTSTIQGRQTSEIAGTTARPSSMLSSLAGATSTTPAQPADLSGRITPEFASGVGSFAVPVANWHVTFVNNGPNDANGAVVGAADGSPSPGLDPSRTGVTCFSAKGASCPASVGVQQSSQGMAIGSWPVGGEVHLLIRTDVISKAGASAVLDAWAKAPAGRIDPSLSDNSVEATYPVVATTARPRADVGVTVGVPLTQTGTLRLDPNGQATFAVFARNYGPDGANGTQLIVPAGLPKYSISCAASGGAICPTSAITAAQIESGIAIPFFPSGGTMELRISVGVPPLFASVDARISVPASIDDPSAANNSSSAGARTGP